LLKLHCRNVVVARDGPKILFENGTRVWFHFAEANGLKAASPLKSEAEAAYSAEEIENLELRHRCLL
jgi:hypothetical protein